MTTLDLSHLHLQSLLAAEAGVGRPDQLKRPSCAFQQPQEVVDNCIKKETGPQLYSGSD